MKTGLSACSDLGADVEVVKENSISNLIRILVFFCFLILFVSRSADEVMCGGSRSADGKMCLTISEV